MKKIMSHIMIKYLVIIVSLLITISIQIIIPTLSYAQTLKINTSNSILDTLNFSNIIFNNEHFDSLHDMMESEHRSRKLIKIELEPNPVIVEDNDSNWHEGTWHRGYYYQKEDSIWLNENINNEYWACHPFIRHTAQYTRSYIHLDKRTENLNEDYQNIINHAFNYLIHIAYRENGGYIWWKNRPAFYSTNSPEIKGSNKPDILVTSHAVKALCEGYWYMIYCCNNNNTNLYNQIIESANWLLYQNYEQVNSNYKGFGAWALANTYKITGNIQYYNKAKEICVKLINEQTKTGVFEGLWLTGGIDQIKIEVDSIDYDYQIYHDTKIDYHLIILGGLLETFTATSDFDIIFKNNLLNAINRGMNHVINYRIISYWRNTIGLYSYYKSTDSTTIPINIKYGTTNGIDVISFLAYYSILSDYYDSCETEILKNLLNGLAAGTLDKIVPHHFMKRSIYNDYITTIKNDEIVNYYTLIKRVTNNDTLLYSSLCLALSESISGDSIEIFCPYYLKDNITIPDGVVLKVKQEGLLYLNSYNIIADGTGYIEYNNYLNFIDSTDYIIYANILINDSAILKIEPGTKIKFTENKSLIIKGSLIAEGTEEDSILFTSANASPGTGDWNGIIFEENATGSLKYCNIHYAQYGIKCNQSDPDILNNTLTHNNYGIYLYCASPEVQSNRITGNTRGFYGYNTASYLFNNRFSHSNNFYGVAFDHYSSPDLYENSFYSNYWGVSVTNYSEPKFGPTNTNDYGLNVIAENSKYGIISDYFSTPFIGSSDSYNMRIGGYNSIYGNPYNVDVGRYSHVEAEYNWWGMYPPNSSTFSIHNDGSLNCYNPLSSNPGGGSTLSKAASTLVASGESENNKFAGFNPKKPNPNRLSDLWLWGYDLFINNKQADAIDVYKQLISKFSGSRQAGNALVKIYHMSRNTGREDLSAYLSDIIQNPEISGSLKPVALALLAGDQLFRKDAQRAVQTYETILNRYPDTKNELHALYSLVLAYNINLKDTESAMKYLFVMKSKYPYEEMTLMAREEMGEKVKWSLAKSGYRDHSDEKTPAIPEEYALRDNYPNPFNPYTTLAFDLPEEARVTLTIYDITGRQVMTLTRDETFPAGFHQIRWDGQNAAGRPVSSGVYLYAMKTSTGFQRIKKMVMVK